MEIKLIKISKINRVILTYERHKVGSGRHIFGNEKHKHRKGKQYCKAECDFFATVWSHPETHQCKNRQHDARNDDVVCIVKCPAAHMDVKRHVWERFLTTGVEHDVSFNLKTERNKKRKEKKEVFI